MQCLNCLKMDYNIEDGTIPRDLVDFDFAEDAWDFENYLLESKKVKFTQPLTEPLAIGSHLRCVATPSEDIPWFTINIGCGDAKTEEDIAVHFNVRIPQRYVVRNTKIHGKWGIEETTSYRPFPFEVGQQFSIEILVGENQTVWAVDGQHFCEYSHRSPSPFTATWIQVSGIRDAVFDEIRKTDIFPTLPPNLSKVPMRAYVDAPSADDEPSWKPNTMAILPKGIPEGYQLVLQGRLRLILHSFAINLMDSTHEWPHPNVLVHVNVRALVESQKDRQLVVLNSWLGEWGPERRQRTARLIPGTATTFRIVRGPGEWSVYADDLLIGELEYRASAAGVKAMSLRGDLFPECIYICPSSNSPVKVHI